MDKVEETLDDTGVKKIILAFEKKALKNQVEISYKLFIELPALRIHIPYQNNIKPY